uniref:Multidrug ABC transporter ATP-binding protein n=1 Tax=Steinernema glaseri TaxID=37863 RepID=A0A1I8AN38_9BILA
MTVTSIGLSAYEAMLFALLSYIVDWLPSIEPALFWSQQGGTLLTIAAVLLGSVVLISLHTLVMHQVLAINFPMRLRWLFHKLMLNQSMSFYADEFAGRITTKIMQTALAVRETLFMAVEVVVGMSAYLIGILILAGSFDRLLILPFLLWLVGYALACVYFVPRLGKVGAEQADARALMTGRITDAYTNINTVKLFAHTRREADHAKNAMRRFQETGHAQMRLISMFEVANHVLATLLLISSAGLALYLWSIDQSTAGVVAAVIAMALRLSGHSHWLMWELTNLFENVGTIQDGINTLTQEPTVVDAPDAKPLQIEQGRIEFQDVSFAYRDKSRQVIDKLNLVIKPGERVGLIGRSGAGKSTLVNLLLRFHDVDSGTIRIDGQDIAHVTQDSLEAHVGERGVKLSGGQRQRVAIARVMLKDAPILLLDEATSALDSEVEAAIQESLNTLMHGKTVIAIAHRLSTIAALDRLIVLDQGRIIEQGSHQELLEKGGLYARLWARQSGGFLGETGKQDG